MILTEFFKPAPPKERLPEKEIEYKYPKLRWQVLESTFLGYAAYYFVRNNLSVVSKEMGEALQYDKSQIGDILAVTAITYGIGKFVMGALSDRSDSRKFMAVGLLITAGINFIFGTVENYFFHLFLWGLNGFVQGMGWPPCGRSIGHWFSLKERGSVFAIWNVAHNVGGGMVGVVAAFSASHWGWRSAFYVPGILAVISSVYIFIRLRDTPQSEGLPPIEEYKKDNPSKQLTEDSERELETKELLTKYIFNNKFLWLFAIANFFVYVVRYSMLDWGPTYLKEMKGASLTSGGMSVLILEFAGIGSTILMGWVSDRLGGRRGMVSLLCMIPIFFAFAAIYYNPPGNLWIDFTMLGIIGFFVYPPVMLLGVASLDVTSKKAVGTAAGFVGLFGYIGRTAQAKGLGWLANHSEYGWNYVLYSILICTILSILFLGFTWNIKPKR
ncbi:MAG TPA: MFS transporter [Leptospiraceae bacterium]|nr:MFS transporter [Leptospiraceae bacterium]HMW07810.1 MFS transporter [Leptospiraceae bacterium]HMX35369.1 MFS transporter [Leptospiraceae bacterium]HMY33505.1 MFS transporter [Leptospiraceae bacterium]HMZ65627.1 MFS transporter [Leptospiraceae bacterium]